MQATIDVDLKPAIEGLALNGYVPGYAKYKRTVVAMGAKTALSARYTDESGAVVLALTDASVVTLPAAADAMGMELTLVNVATSGAAEIALKPAATDSIIGTVAAVSSGGVAGKMWINTKATAVKGDYSKVVCDGTSWYLIGGVGVWASEV